MTNVIEKDVEYNQITEIESLCMKCKLNGKTRILLTKIPFYRDVVVMSFSCDHCGFSNNEIQSSQALEENGVKFDFKVINKEDLDRLVVASTYSLIFIPELDLEIPKVSKGLVTTVQGLMDTFIKDLEMNQDLRKTQDPEGYAKIEEFLTRLRKYWSGEDEIFPFHLILDDPSGNSFIANPFAPFIDVRLKVLKYKRSKEQLYAMGHISEQEFQADKDMQEKYNKMKGDYKEYSKGLAKQKIPVHTDQDISNMMEKMVGKKPKDGHKLDHSKNVVDQDLDDRLTLIAIPCNNCQVMGSLKTVTCEIPFFKEIVIMSFSCEHCGYKDTDVKTGGEIGPYAKRITLTVKSEDDLNRDIFKSDTATVEIPELEFTMQAGSLGSLYTTVEGLLMKFVDSLKTENPFVGDSADTERMVKFYEFIGKLEDMRNGKILPFTIILDDAIDNSFILNPYYPKEDPNVKVVEYERTDEQKAELGLDYMKTD